MSTPAKLPPAKKRARDEEASGNAPALAALLGPKNSVMLAVERALLRGEGAHASPPIAEQIAARLAGLIALDQLRPGQRLLENDIGDVLRVSRAPVREAIRILERDHLVQLSARRGATVTAPDARELQDIFELRAALFTILLEQLMRDRPADLEKVFAGFIPKLEKASGETTDAYAVQSFLLNLAITDLGDNRLVIDNLKQISLRTLRYVRMGLASSAEAVPKSLRTWKAFHAAVAKRDAAQVVEIAMKRISAIRDYSVAAVKKAKAR
jgi:DNA-binding GntR family transcriptional regulator